MNAMLHQEAPESLDPAGRRWLAENLLLGFGRDELASALTSADYDRGQVERALDEIVGDPVFQVSCQTAGRLRKAESLLAVYHQLDGLDQPPGTVERRGHVSADEFLHGYYARNRPVVLTGLARGWPATSRWTPEYLRDRCGAELVEVMAGREADERFEVNSESHKRQVRFSEYVDTVLEAGQSNDTYLVANNHFLDSACGADLLRDLRPLPDLLADEHVAGTTFMWFGPGGTVTPLHHDTMNVLLVQVHGHKRVTLVPSTQLPLVYNEESVYSAVDLEAPDEERHPLFGRTDRIGITLDAGDALFIPVGWWHHVRALDVSISVSFTNFAFPNSYEWQHPESLG